MITLTTQCPHCETQFSVNASELQRRKGLVRCVQCAHIFDGYEAVVGPPAQGGQPSAMVLEHKVVPTQHPIPPSDSDTVNEPIADTLDEPTTAGPLDAPIDGPSDTAAKTIGTDSAPSFTAAKPILFIRGACSDSTTKKSDLSEISFGHLADDEPVFRFGDGAPIRHPDDEFIVPADDAPIQDTDDGRTEHVDGVPLMSAEGDHPIKQAGAAPTEHADDDLIIATDDEPIVPRDDESPSAYVEEAVATAADEPVVFLHSLPAAPDTDEPVLPTDEVPLEPSTEFIVGQGLTEAAAAADGPEQKSWFIGTVDEYESDTSKEPTQQFYIVDEQEKTDSIITAPLDSADDSTDDAVVYAERRIEPAAYSLAAQLKTLAMRLFVLILVVGALLQAAYVYRAQIALSVPFTRPALQSFCAYLGCEVPYLRVISSIEITYSRLSAESAPAKQAESSAAAQGQTTAAQIAIEGVGTEAALAAETDSKAVSGADEAARNPEADQDGAGQSRGQYYLLQLGLHNQATLPQEWPTLMVTFNDAAATVLARIEIAPEQYLNSAQRSGPFLPGQTVELRLQVHARDHTINGFKVEKFFS